MYFWLFQYKPRSSALELIKKLFLNSERSNHMPLKFTSIFFYTKILIREVAGSQTSVFRAFYFILLHFILDIFFLFWVVFCHESRWQWNSSMIPIRIPVGISTKRILLKNADDWNYHTLSDFSINWFELFFIFGIFYFCHKFFIPKW